MRRDFYVSNTVSGWLHGLVLTVIDDPSPYCDEQTSDGGRPVAFRSESGRIYQQDMAPRSAGVFAVGSRWRVVDQWSEDRLADGVVVERVEQ